MFMPLVTDVVASMTSATFTVSDVQEQLAIRRQIAMPQNAVTTLLHRATKKGFLVREHGAYKKSAKGLTRSEIESQKGLTQAAYGRLANAFREHAAHRQLALDSYDDALKLLIQFLEEQHVGLLLGTPLTLIDRSGASKRSIDIAAEFVQKILKDESELSSTLTGIVEALVFYRVAFLPDASTQRKFSNLRVYFDSGLVRQALG
jgi:predicted transcriptional regulator